MSEEEAIKWLKETINYYKKDIKDNGKGFLREETLEKYETLLNIIEKKDKIMNLMAKWIFDKDYKENSLLIHRDDYYSNCIKQVKEYFENKIKEE